MILPLSNYPRLYTAGLKNVYDDQERRTER
jgi:hypothetical protein